MGEWQAVEAPAWFTIDADAYPLAWLMGSRAPCKVSPEFYERIAPLGADEVARPHDRATRDRLAMECEEVAELLVQVAGEDGHAGMLASALHALVLRIAGGGIEETGEDA